MCEKKDIDTTVVKVLPSSLVLFRSTEYICTRRQLHEGQMLQQKVKVHGTSDTAAKPKGKTLRREGGVQVPRASSPSGYKRLLHRIGVNNPWGNRGTW